MQLKVNYVLPRSQVQGPGTRYTIWVQGCSIHCCGCSNSDTWDPEGGYGITLDDLVTDITYDKGLDGLTLTGGEPLDQFDSVLGLCKRLFGHTSIFLITGYTLDQIFKKGLHQITSYVDILCTGPFEETAVCRGEWRGSINQSICFLTEKGKQQSNLPVILKEVYIDERGNALSTGFTISTRGSLRL